RAFCAGADLDEEGDLDDETVHKFIKEDNRNYDVLNEMPQPVISAVNGYALGGGFELLLASDIRIAADNAKVGAVGVKVGLVVSPTRLVRLVGESVAKEMILTGRTVLADEGYEKGLFYKVVSPEDLMSEARKLATTISSRAPIAVEKSKKAIQKTTDLTYQQSMEYEIEQFISCQKTYDHKHAIEAFFKKEKPVFRGE